MSEELKPCPFCGWDIRPFADVEVGECGNCGATGPTVPNMGGGVAAWNNRAYDALRARHEKLINLPRWVHMKHNPNFEHPNGDWVRHADIRAALEDE